MEPIKRICPGCQTETFGPEKYCVKCGTQMEEPEQPTKCAQCGAEIGDLAFCTTCGAPTNNSVAGMPSNAYSPTGKSAKKKKPLVALIAGGGLVVAVALILIIILVIVPNNRYNKAVTLFNNGRYSAAYSELAKLSVSFKDVNELLPYYWAHVLFDDGDYKEAIEQFSSISYYKNSTLMRDESSYLLAHDLFKSGKYDEARNLFDALDRYKDSRDMVTESKYQLALSILNEEGERAKRIFIELDDYKDSEDMLIECDYSIAVSLMEAKDYDEAKSRFILLGDFKDSEDMVFECDYRMAVDLLDEKDYDEARYRFTLLGDFKDSEDMVLECDYRMAVDLLDEKEYSAAYYIFTVLENYKDSPDMTKECRYRYGKDLLEEGDISGARSRFAYLADYKDSEEFLKECDYQQGLLYIAEGDHSRALAILNSILDYKDTIIQLEPVYAPLYQRAMLLYDWGWRTNAKELFETLGNYNDSAAKVAEINELINNGYTPPQDIGFVFDLTAETTTDLDLRTNVVSIEESLYSLSLPDGYTHEYFTVLTDTSAFSIIYNGSRYTVYTREKQNFQRNFLDITYLFSTPKGRDVYRRFYEIGDGFYESFYVGTEIAFWFVLDMIVSPSSSINEEQYNIDTIFDIVENAKNTTPITSLTGTALFGKSSDGRNAAHLEIKDLSITSLNISRDVQFARYGRNNISFFMGRFRNNNNYRFDDVSVSAITVDFNDNEILFYLFPFDFSYYFGRGGSDVLDSGAGTKAEIDEYNGYTIHKYTAGRHSDFSDFIFCKVFNRDGSEYSDNWITIIIPTHLSPPEYLGSGLTISNGTETQRMELMQTLLDGMVQYGSRSQRGLS